MVVVIVTLLYLYKQKRSLTNMASDLLDQGFRDPIVPQKTQLRPCQFGYFDEYNNKIHFLT